ncbi:ubiquinol-cytochrome c chaperone, partial [Colletotrichum plurivorum]
TRVSGFRARAGRKVPPQSRRRPRPRSRPPVPFRSTQALLCVEKTNSNSATMACQTCRYQARLLARSLRATADLSSSAAAPWSPVTGTAARRAAVTSPQATTAPTTPAGRRYFSQSAARRNGPASSTNFKQAVRAGMLAAAPKTMAASLTTSRLEALYGVCAKPALYKILEQDRHNETVRLTVDGEEVGEPLGPWLELLDLPPSFSSWSQATMLHMYIILARLRCLERDAAQALQHQFIDQFFFDCERMMHLNHGMTSSALRQRYLKEIFVQWRGLIAAYDEGVVKDDRVLGAAVWRNLFKSREEADMREVAAVVAWIRATLRDFEAGAVEDLLIDPRGIFKRDLADMFKLVDAFTPQLKSEFEGLGATAEEMPPPEPVAESQDGAFAEEAAEAAGEEAAAKAPAS